MEAFPVQSIFKGVLLGSVVGGVVAAVRSLQRSHMKQEGCKLEPRPLHFDTLAPELNPLFFQLFSYQDLCKREDRAAYVAHVRTAMLYSDYTLCVECQLIKNEVPKKWTQWKQAKEYALYALWHIRQLPYFFLGSETVVEEMVETSTELLTYLTVHLDAIYTYTSQLD